MHKMRGKGKKKKKGGKKKSRGWLDWLLQFYKDSMSA